MNRELPPLRFWLTPHERDRAALAALELERKRRDANARDASRPTHRPATGQPR